VIANVCQANNARWYSCDRTRRLRSERQSKTIRNFWPRATSWTTRTSLFTFKKVMFMKTAYFLVSLLLGIDVESKEIPCGLVDTIGSISKLTLPLSWFLTVWQGVIRLPRRWSIKQSKVSIQARKLLLCLRRNTKCASGVLSRAISWLALVRFSLSLPSGPAAQLYSDR
jgi:hypothetical protein